MMRIRRFGMRNNKFTSGKNLFTTPFKSVKMRAENNKSKTKEKETMPCLLQKKTCAGA